TTHTFNVIKQGSTSGKRLLVIDMPGNSLIPIAGIGSQDNLDNMSGTRTPGTGNGPYKKGPFYSLASRTDITYSSDALMNIPNIDFVGYRAKSAGISPLVLTNGEFYLVSPNDTTMLTSTYAGSTVTTIALVGSSGTANITVDGVTKTATYVTSTTQTATNFVTANAAAYSAAGYTLTSSAANLIWSAKNPNMGSKTGKIANVTGTLSGTQIRDEKNDLLASVIRQMTSSLPVGQTLKKVYFKRLDNITTDANQTRVTSTYFDQLTHDNEFDVLLNGIQAGGRTIAGPIGYNQVYGFVMEDGRRGLIKVTPSVIGTFPVSLPTAGNGVLYGSIKFQEN
ncbi:MAG: hypothetical protein JWQ25_3328, partial [Daejeonella sp.]|nr:hypothetical protein [Daejeonella sp.]